MQYKSLKVSVGDDFVAHVELNRPEKLNAFTAEMLGDIKKAFEWLDEHAGVRAVVLSAKGKAFCAGIDLDSLKPILALKHSSDHARARAKLREQILRMQEAMSAIEGNRWPVVAAIHGACIGGGVDLIAACDVRLCSANAVFSVKEVDIGIAADLGSLQRLPHIIGYGATAELALTARNFQANEALKFGLVTAVVADQATVLERALKLAAQMAQKSPLAITGTKHILLHARDSTTRQGLQYVAAWNSSQMLSDDLYEALQAKQIGRHPLYSRL